MRTDRRSHWIKVNHQERMPARMVAFDTESRSSYDDNIEVQEWRVGCAIRWRTDLQTGDRCEAAVFDTPESFWSWVADFTKPGHRTVVWAHNLGHDIRISDMFRILPLHGFHLEWCNLDRNISSATWRSSHGTIVLADTWTWIPLPLETIAPQAGMVKYEMPANRAPDSEWARYCMRDAEILYRVVSILLSFIRTEHLGNWQPTGAGMAYATWRHRFMQHKVLVNDDNDAIQAERIAMHTGRAEAWRHGEIWGEKWTEIDLRNAYLRIAAECELPRKLHYHTGAISVRQFERLQDRFAVLCRVTVSQEKPVLPYRINGRHLWPTGTFETWVWDNELSCALRHGATVRIREAYTYVRDPILREWAQWVMRVLYDSTEQVSPVVKTHIKHCSRALIGRISLRVPSWEYFGTNLEGITGITHIVLPEEQRTTRLLHVGGDTLIETERMEGKDSLPMITGWIMAECRVRLWEMMQVVGEDNLAHVDTDSVLCNSAGLSRVDDMVFRGPTSPWTVKGTWTRLNMIGPRCYYRGRERVTAGIPRKADETSPGVFTGERWSALSSDLEKGRPASVSVHPGTWEIRQGDPRRTDAPGVGGRTAAYDAAGLSSANTSASGETNCGS